MEYTSKVYFIKVSESDPVDTVKEKLARLIDESRLFDFIGKKDKTAVKIHFGDEGNTVALAFRQPADNGGGQDIDNVL